MQPFRFGRYLKITTIPVDERTMTKMFVKSSLTLTLLAVLFLAVAIPAHAGSVNKSVKIADGETSGGTSSVNGSIYVGRAAVVNGDLSTVNGRIRVEADARVEDLSTVNGGLRVDSGVIADDLSTVNGAIDIAQNVTINGAIETVNGQIDIDSGSKVARDVSNVNGRILLKASAVGGDLSTVSGDIELADASEVGGDVIVEKSHGWNWNHGKSSIPSVVIGPGSRVHGALRLEREVQLFISDSADVGSVTGVMSLSDATRFSGEHP